MKIYLVSFIYAIGTFLTVKVFLLPTRWERCDVLDLGIFILLLAWFTYDVIISKPTKAHPSIRMEDFLKLSLKEKIDLLKEGVQIIGEKK